MQAQACQPLNGSVYVVPAVHESSCNGLDTHQGGASHVETNIPVQGVPFFQSVPCFHLSQYLFVHAREVGEQRGHGLCIGNSSRPVLLLLVLRGKAATGSLRRRARRVVLVLGGLEKAAVGVFPTPLQVERAGNEAGHTGDKDLVCSITLRTSFLKFICFVLKFNRSSTEEMSDADKKAQPKPSSPKELKKILVPCSNKQAKRTMLNKQAKAHNLKKQGLSKFLFLYTISLQTSVSYFL